MLKLLAYAHKQLRQEDSLDKAFLQFSQNWVWLKRRGKEQILVRVSTHQGKPFWHRFFEPQPIVIHPNWYEVEFVHPQHQGGSRRDTRRVHQ